jgi:transcriptional regulator with XRE-family HTH domain
LRRRRLAKTLGQLRSAAGMTAEEVAAELKKTGGRWSKSKVSRIEDPQHAAPSPRDVRDMLELYGVRDQHRQDALTQLAEEAQQRGWWTAYEDVLRNSHIGFEAEASAIRNFEALCVPGLLQTEGYARAIIQAALAAEPDRAAEQVGRHVEARMKRQEIFARTPPPQLSAVIDEAALRRLVGGPDIMREQIGQLTSASKRPNVTLQVILARTGAHPGMSGPFAILEFVHPDDAPIIFLEAATEHLFLEEPEQIRKYVLRFDYIRANALKPDESIRFMNTIRDQLR